MDLPHVEHVALVELAAGDRDVVVGRRVVLAHVGPHRALHDEREYRHAVPGVLRREALSEEVDDELLDVHVADVGQRPAFEVGANVALEHAPVPTAGGWAKFCRRLPPTIRPLLEGDTSQLGVDPLPPADVVSDVVEEALRIGLAQECF